MNDDMLGQISYIHKRLVAHMALVRPHIVMVTDVISKLTGLHKPVQKKIWKKSVFLPVWRSEDKF